MANKNFLALDLGASSGRGIVGGFDGKSFSLEEIHRFSNDPLYVNSGFYWDILRLFHEIKTAIGKTAGYGNIESLGIDTWGVDYGIIDRAGALLSNPRNYRDDRTMGIDSEVFKVISKKELYSVTGIQSQNINTIYQLYSEKKYRPWLLENADKILMTPDLLTYFLTGEAVCEYTIASTGAITNAAERCIAENVVSRLGINSNLFPKIVQPGDYSCNMLQSVEEECLVHGVSVVSVASHDTASAVLAVPADTEDFLFISSGTWSIMGSELSHPILNEAAMRTGFSNEGGAFGTTCFICNIMGLWLEQESRRQWRREGKEYTFDELSYAALNSDSCTSLIDPNSQMFVPAGNMPKRISEFCIKTAQKSPENAGEIVRCIFDSLALTYRHTAEKIEALTGKKYSVINIVGGGAREELLSQLTADCTGKCVIAGPVEATALGNIAYQAYAAGELGSKREIRDAVKMSGEVKVYEPNKKTAEMWDEAYLRYLKIISK